MFLRLSNGRYLPFLRESSDSPVLPLCLPFPLSTTRKRLEFFSFPLGGARLSGIALGEAVSGAPSPLPFTCLRLSTRPWPGSGLEQVSVLSSREQIPLNIAYLVLGWPPWGIFCFFHASTPLKYKVEN